MQMPPWMASMESFAPLIMPVLEILRPQVIGEIGAAEGGNTRVLYDFMKATQGKLITIEPLPRGSFVEWANASRDVVTHIAEYSLHAIPQAGKVDVWFVDGDHNWYTVFNELTLIHQSAEKHNTPAVIFMHDVSWPCARRDMYYNPSQIPAAFIQPNSAELGITFAPQATPNGGLKGVHWALTEGGAKNGVLTAVEDFMQSTPTTYYWFNVPAILGLGILVDAKHPLAQVIAEFYQPYHNNPVMELVERNRVENYLIAVNLCTQLKEAMAKKVMA